MKFETVITADHGSKLNMKELMRYRDLIWLFVKRDFVAKYKQTILGPLWAILQPLMTTIVFNVIFGNLAHLTTADTADGLPVPGFLFYMAGTICWSYFSQTVMGTANTFISNYRILGKVYFPRMVMPISGALSNLISFAIRFVMFLCFWVWFAVIKGCGIRLSPCILLLPLLLLQLVLMSIGFGLLISSVTTKYRDMIQLALRDAGGLRPFADPGKVPGALPPQPRDDGDHRIPLCLLWERILPRRVLFIELGRDRAGAGLRALALWQSRKNIHGYFMREKPIMPKA